MVQVGFWGLFTASQRVFWVLGRFLFLRPRDPATVAGVVWVRRKRDTGAAARWKQRDTAEPAWCFDKWRVYIFPFFYIYIYIWYMIYVYMIRQIPSSIFVGTVEIGVVFLYFLVATWWSGWRDQIFGWNPRINDSVLVGTLRWLYTYIHIYIYTYDINTHGLVLKAEKCGMPKKRSKLIIGTMMTNQWIEWGTYINK